MTFSLTNFNIEGGGLLGAGVGIAISVFFRVYI